MKKLSLYATVIALCASTGSLARWIVPEHPTTEDSAKIVIGGAFPSTCGDLGPWYIGHDNYTRHVWGYVDLMDYSDTASDCADTTIFWEVVCELGQLRAGVWTIAIMVRYVTPDTLPPEGEHGDLFGEFTVTEASVDVELDRYAGQPSQPVLDQNSPNPFNPMTQIRFTLPEASAVRLDIYNIAGQKVATLVDETLEAGSHTAIWDASANASGVYLYRLTTNDYSDSKKMLLLK